MKLITDNMNFTPQHDRVLLKPAKNLSSIGGLLIPESSLQKRRVGTIMAVGNGKDKDNKVYIPVGVEVMFNANAGMEIIIDGVEYLSMSQEDVLVVFDKKEKLGFTLHTLRIMILTDPIKTKDGALEIPRKAQQISRKGTVIAVGDDIKDEMLPFKPNDYVAFFGNAGSGLIGGEEFGLPAKNKYVILRPQQIIGKFTT